MTGIKESPPEGVKSEDRTLEARTGYRAPSEELETLRRDIRRSDLERIARVLRQTADDIEAGCSPNPDGSRGDSYARGQAGGIRVALELLETMAGVR